MPRAIVYFDRRWYLALLLLSRLLDPSYAQGPDKTQSDPLIRVQTNLITVDVIVTDKDGHHVADLKKEDFHLFEDGKEQSISGFEREDLDKRPVGAAGSEVRNEPKRAPEAIPPARPASRKVVLLFDHFNSDYGNRINSREAAKRFIQSELGDSDPVSVVLYDGSLKVLVDFTSDRQRLLTAFSQMEKKAGFENIGKAATQRLINDVKTCAELGSRPGRQCALATAREFVYQQEFQSRRTLTALQALIENLGLLEGRKSVVLFSDGFSLEAGRLAGAAVALFFGTAAAQEVAGISSVLRADLTKVIGAATTANVTFYTIDSRGLIAQLLQDASMQVAVPVNSDMERELRDGLQDGLSALAVDTGGRRFFNNNDLHGSLVRAIADAASYYTLSYMPANLKLDGSYRKIEVKVERRGVQIRARKGYWARPTTQFAVRGDVFMDKLAVGEALIQVPFKLSLRVEDLNFQKKSGKLTTQIAVLGRIRDKEGQLVSSFIDLITPAYTEKEFEPKKKEGLVYESWLMLSANQVYYISWTLKELETGNYGTFERSVALDSEKLAGMKKLITIPVTAKTADKANRLNQSAQQALKRGDADRAIQEFKQVTQLMPQIAEAHYNLGLAYHKKGLEEEALQAWQKAVEVDPKQFLARLNLSALYMKKNNKSGALRLLEEAAAYAPSTPEALNLLGGAYVNIGETPRAIELYQHMIKTYPNAPAGYGALGELYQGLAVWEKAIASYQKYIELRGPRFVEAYGVLGNIYKRIGDPEKAREYYRKYIEAGGERANQARQALRALEKSS